MERMQHWAADREAVLDAKLAGMKAGLKLTPDQEKLWPPFEAAVRDAAKMRMDAMQQMMGRMEKMRHMEGGDNKSDTIGEGGERLSPVDRLEMMADRMSEGSAAIKKVADAAKPLYAGLDDTQKHLFGLLGRELMMRGHGPMMMHSMMMHGHHPEGMGGGGHGDEGSDE
jgi:hypothetical protein